MALLASQPRAERGAWLNACPAGGVVAVPPCLRRDKVRFYHAEGVAPSPAPFSCDAPPVDKVARGIEVVSRNEEDVRYLIERHKDAHLPSVPLLHRLPPAFYRPPQACGHIWVAVCFDQ